jgi:hypothetical protein
MLLTIGLAYTKNVQITWYAVWYWGTKSEHPKLNSWSEPLNYLKKVRLWSTILSGWVQTNL